MRCIQIAHRQRGLAVPGTAVGLPRAVLEHGGAVGFLQFDVNFIIADGAALIVKDRQVGVAKTPPVQEQPVTVQRDVGNAWIADNDRCRPLRQSNQL